ncbi:O-antigen ligase family protein [Pedosphaera parvula]|uniref:O-antigen polymerase n=1 Tax=Pedosphaera parvula (strain Ellin514) TaxID=320771 RepID=B9XAX9_PEDPL|nr:O-antigen ligase family protein [Pedosphaera parvula]EEF63164.1 O-antigen polymerase [Pedosphaera parvula Ellin514]
MRAGLKSFTPAIRYWNPPGLPSALIVSATRTPAKAASFNPTPILAQVLFCVLLTGGVLATGRARLAGIVFWGALGLILVRQFVWGGSLKVLCLLIGTAPFINLLRGFALYNIVILLFVAALTYHMISRPGEMRLIWRKASLLKPMFVCIAAFYALSLFNTRDYSVNLRLFELALTLMVLLILGQNPVALGTALTANLVSAWVVGFSLLSQMNSSSVARLGMIVMDGQTLGNPIQLGLPLAFGFLALIIDRGYWLNLQHRPVLRYCMLVPTLPLLALTTSRSAWLVAAGGIMVTFLAGKKQRIIMLMTIALGFLAFQAVLLSPYGKSLKKGLDRTFSERRTASQRTSGRSDQWRVSYYAFTESPVTMLIGHGPGRGAEVYADYSHEVGGVKYAVGKKVALHSLFMQVAVEAGCLGLSLLGLWLFLIFIRITRQTLLHRAMLPLACYFGYLFVVITVSGNDVNSGILLGLALLGSMVVPAQTTKRQAMRVQLEGRARLNHKTAFSAT